MHAMPTADRDMPHVTFDEYLVSENTSTVRHELVGGQVHAMAGATRAHNRVILNLVRRLDDAAQAKGCRLSAETVKLKIMDTTVYYPDLMVACGPPVHDLYEIAPCLIVEVLSPSTADLDRREKLGAYLSLASVVTYLIVDPTARTIQAHSRVEDRWRTTTYVASESIELICPKVTLSVDESFANLH
jgi:Uma2 family endonuclease